MKAFEYAAPTTVEDAVRLLDGPNAVALSGGVDLIGRMKDYVTSPDRVVYLKDIQDLAGISGDPQAGGLTIGAGTRLADIVAHAGIRASYPALWQATVEVGSVQIRNMSTVGGNLLQRPRCWYYRAGFGLLAIKDGQSLVRAGDNRYHSIFLTNGDALFVSPSSLAVALSALDAQATIRGPRGERTVKVEDLYQVPRRETDSELTIQPGEVLSKVILPAARGKSASYEARQKQAQDWPLVLASVNLMMDNQTVSAAKVVLYGVAPIPWRSQAAERAITGKPVTVESAAAAGEAAVEGAAPLSMNAYKVPLTRAVVKRALLRALNPKGYWEEA
ncbi:MAG TPA: FAD binding domain-containing protein [Isosphaeraceae bacterium]|nr:FAD binding domain-containing protein [Isosphaeraceae bacterium]